ncbi:MAG: hypothetical protein R3A10_06865 [Caldilineaceae bacterium]
MSTETDIEPEYTWYNGTADRYLLGDTIDPTTVTSLNTPNGSIDDPTARIFPFKIHVAKQIYDSEYDYLLQPKTVGEGGFWTEFDWDLAAELGAEATDMAYSGSYDFAETEMYWPLTHMVQPGERALQCQDCHDENGRMDWQALGYPGDPMYSGSRNTGAVSSLISGKSLTAGRMVSSMFAHFRFRRRITVAALLTAGIVVTALVMLTVARPALAQSTTLHPTFPLLDADGVNVLDSGAPLSTMQTCGNCHDTAFIAEHSFHADVGLAQFDVPGSRADGRAWDSSGGLFGKWNPLTYRYLSPKGDAVIDLTTAAWLETLGLRHVGGGPAVTSREGTPSSICRLIRPLPRWRPASSTRPQAN